MCDCWGHRPGELKPIPSLTAALRRCPLFHHQKKNAMTLHIIIFTAIAIGSLLMGLAALNDADHAQ